MQMMKLETKNYYSSSLKSSIYKAIHPKNEIFKFSEVIRATKWVRPFLKISRITNY